ncbi:MAG TPA: TolC family protein [Chryseolinea sp.]|nr:TolC family protein [Chryseolinea sp.]
MEIRIKQKAESIKQKAVSSQLITIAFVLFAVHANAQVITLDSVLAIIDRKNPMLQEFDSKVAALNAYAKGSKSWMAPMVGVGPYWYPYPGQTIMSEAEKGMFMATIEQDIPNPAKLNAKRNYFASKADVQQQGRAIQYNLLRSEAKAMYYKWLVAEQKQNALRENERIIELMLKLARIRYPYNQGSLGNVYKAEGRLHEVQNMMLMTDADIEEFSFRLKTLMNVDVNDSIMIDTTMTVKFEPLQLVYDTSLLSMQRSDVKQINESIEAMYLNQQLQRVQAKPDFRIRFDHMDPRGEGMPQQFSLMAMVSIPIAPWSSKMYKAEVKGMQYDIEAMKKNRESLLIEARGMLAGMANQLVRMQQQLQNYNGKIIPALRKNYEMVMLAYEENREQLPMVIDAWEAMNMAQLEYLEKLENYYNMIVNYEKELER